MNARALADLPTSAVAAESDPALDTSLVGEAAVASLEAVSAQSVVILRLRWAVRGLVAYAAVDLLGRFL